MRMLYCPARSPRSFSSRLPGGTRRSSRDSAASSISSLRSAGRRTDGENDFTGSRRKSRSVSLSPNDWIIQPTLTSRPNNVKRHAQSREDTHSPNALDNGDRGVDSPFTIGAAEVSRSSSCSGASAAPGNVRRRGLPISGHVRPMRQRAQANHATSQDRNPPRSAKPACALPDQWRPG